MRGLVNKKKKLPENKKIRRIIVIKLLWLFLESCLISLAFTEKNKVKLMHPNNVYK
jgi:hypothetical protein